MRHIYDDICQGKHYSPVSMNHHRTAHNHQPAQPSSSCSLRNRENIVTFSIKHTKAAETPVCIALVRGEISAFNLTHKRPKTIPVSRSQRQQRIKSVRVQQPVFQSPATLPNVHADPKCLNSINWFLPKHDVYSRPSL